jgi:hypothetical protein
MGFVCVKIEDAMMQALSSARRVSQVVGEEWRPEHESTHLNIKLDCSRQERKDPPISTKHFDG